MTFTGDAGTVMMWMWDGFSDDLVAVLAAITLVWDISNVAGDIINVARDSLPLRTVPVSRRQRAMRHGDIRVTMNVYGDPVSDALRDASSKVAERAIGQLLTKSVS